MAWLINTLRLMLNWGADGRCGMCGKALVSVGETCDDCLEINREI